MTKVWGCKKKVKRKIRVLYITYTDKVGERFNCFALRKNLSESFQIEPSFLVWQKSSGCTSVKELCPWLPFRRYIRYIFRVAEDFLALQSVLLPFGIFVFFDRRFWKADVVHLHLLHNQYFSILLIPILSRLKPCIWTIHDPWICTGHCIHPLDCQKWKKGCSLCPDLSRQFPMRWDNTKRNWNIRRAVVKWSDVHLVAATEWMSSYMKSSSITKSKRISIIPFGIDTTIFNAFGRTMSRQAMNIPQESVVFMFRGDTSEFKGLSFVIDLVKNLPTDIRVDLLIVGMKGLYYPAKENVVIHEFGWVEDQLVLADIYRSADIFLMPSIAESFGFMALEALACGAKVVTFKGTATSNIDTSIVSVPYLDQKAFTSAALDECLKSKLRTKGGFHFDASESYSIDKYLSALVSLYNHELYLRRNLID